jgi:type I restriction enzyme S subunit
VGGLMSRLVPKLRFKEFSGEWYGRPKLIEFDKIKSLGCTSLVLLSAVFFTLSSVLKQHKKGLMQQLFPAEGEREPKLRFKAFSGEWVENSFDYIFNRIPSKKYQIKSDEYLTKGKYPVVDQGKSKIIAYSNNKNKLFTNGDIIIFGDHTRILKYIDFNFIVGADGTQLIKTKKTFNTKFFYYQTLKSKIPNTGYNRHFKFIKDMLFTIPTPKEQQKIANTLSTLDNLIEAQNQQINHSISFINLK